MRSVWMVSALAHSARGVQPKGADQDDLNDLKLVSNMFKTCNPVRCHTWLSQAEAEAETEAGTGAGAEAGAEADEAVAEAVADGRWLMADGPMTER